MPRSGTAGRPVTPAGADQTRMSPLVESPAPGPSPGAIAAAARRAGRRALADALRASRADTLAAFADFERALPGLVVPRTDELNPPLWELGHIGWFQEYWLSRNPQRDRGVAADPDAARPDGVRPGADALYHSSRVAHGERWSLALPDARATRADLAAQLAATLALLDGAADVDDALYFFRLSLFHEDMHHEAALYMAQGLGIAVADGRWQPRPLPEAGGAVELPAATWRLGHEGPGFGFDNELRAHEVDVAACAIDSRVVRWDEYLAFVDAGGYDDPPATTTRAGGATPAAPGWRQRAPQRRATCAARATVGSNGGTGAGPRSTRRCPPAT